MTGHYFECDACHLRDFGADPPVGWVGVSQVLAIHSPDNDPHGEAGQGVKEQHACSVPCAITLLTPPTAEGIH